MSSHYPVPKVYNVVPQVKPYIMLDRNHCSKDQAVPAELPRLFRHSTMSYSAEAFFVGWCVTVLLLCPPFLPPHWSLPATIHFQELKSDMSLRVSSWPTSRCVVQCSNIFCDAFGSNVTPN